MKEQPIDCLATCRIVLAILYKLSARSGIVFYTRMLRAILGAGEVWNNLEIIGETGVLVQSWTFVSEAHGAMIWEIQEDLTIIFSDEIQDVVIWMKRNSTQVKTLIPAHVWKMHAQ